MGDLRSPKTPSVLRTRLTDLLGVGHLLLKRRSVLGELRSPIAPSVLRTRLTDLLGVDHLLLKRRNVLEDRQSDSVTHQEVLLVISKKELILTIHLVLRGLP